MDAESHAKDIEIVVKAFGGMRKAFPDGMEAVRLPEGATIGALLRQLDADAPEFAEKLRDGMAAGYLNVLVNGRNVRFLQGDDTVLQDHDTVAFLPPVGGG